jgi:hypothetical protein
MITGLLATRHRALEAGVLPRALATSLALNDAVLTTPMRNSATLCRPLCSLPPCSPSASSCETPLQPNQYRSASVKREFQLTHPCPVTGRTSGACPGYVKDHVVPVACGVSWRSSGQWDRRRHRPDRRRKTLGEGRAGRDNLEILAQAKEIPVHDICVTS